MAKQQNPDNAQANAMRALTRALKALDRKGMVWAQAAVEEEIAARAKAASAGQSAYAKPSTSAT